MAATLANDALGTLLVAFCAYEALVDADDASLERSLNQAAFEMPITMMPRSTDPRTAGLKELGWGGNASASDAVRLMEKFADVEVGSQGCFRLNRLARRGEWQVVLDVGGIAAIMDAMKAHPSIELQEEGLHALSYLLEMGGNAVLEEVQSAGGAELLQAAQNRWADKKFFQYFCTAAVGRLLGPAAATGAAQQNLYADEDPKSEPEPEPEPEEDFSLPYNFAPGGGGGGTRRLLPPEYI